MTYVIDRSQRSFVKSDLYKMGQFDSAGRFYPTDKIAVHYVNEYEIRSPSRSFPLSYWIALKTQRFYRYYKAMDTSYTPTDDDISQGLADRNSGVRSAWKNRLRTLIDSELHADDAGVEGYIL